jgi:CBS domain-containing protein
MKKGPTLTVKTREVMNTMVLAVSRGALGRDIAAQFLASGKSGFPVIEYTRELIGIVTELDLLKAMESGKDLASVTAGDIMSKPPIVVEEETPLKAVVQMMQKKNILRVPVVRNGKLVGLVSRSDILRHMITPKKMICAYGPF